MGTTRTVIGQVGLLVFLMLLDNMKQVEERLSYLLLSRNTHVSKQHTLLTGGFPTSPNYLCLKTRQPQWIRLHFLSHFLHSCPSNRHQLPSVYFKCPSVSCSQ